MMNDASITPRRRLVRWWGWFFLATLAVELLIAQRYFAVVDPVDGALWLFRMVMLVAHFSGLTLLLLSPALLLALVWPRSLIVRGAGVALAIASLALLLIDTQIYQLYRMHFDLGVFNLLFGGAAAETFIFPGVMYAQAGGIALAVVVVVLAMSALAWRIAQRLQAPKIVSATLMATFVACVLGFHGVYMWADASGVEAITADADVLPAHYAVTAKRFMRRAGVAIQPQLRAQSVSDKTGLAYPLSPVQCARPERRPNIVLIAIDSWRFDAFNERATPNVARFARRASVFKDHFSGGNATRMGIFSLFYSIPGTYWDRVFSEGEPPVIIRELMEQDYDVRAFRSTPIYSPELDRTVFAGVPNLRRESDGNDPGEWDRDLTNDFKAFLGARDKKQPFFSLLFYDAPHAFTYPKGYPLKFNPVLENVNYLKLTATTDPEPFFNRYLNAVHYDDSLIGEVLQAIEAAELMDDTLIIITGDHAQEFNDTGKNYWGHNSNFSRYQTGVPLIWYEPGRKPAVYEHRTSHYDVMPTILSDVLECDFEFEEISVGAPLFEPSPREVIVISNYNDFAILQPDRIATVKNSGMSMFDLQYRPMKGVRPTPKVIGQALEQKRRFYK